MSLVNQVLRDLDARREAPPLDDALEGLHSAPPAPRTGHKVGVALGVAGLLGVAGVMGWLYLQPPVSPDSQPDRAAAPSAPAPADAPEPVPMPPPTDTLPARDGITATPLPLQPGADLQALTAASGDNAPTTDADASAETPNPVSPDQADAVTPARAAVAPAAAPSEPDATPAPATGMRKTPRPLSPEDRAEQAFADGLQALKQDRWRSAEQQLRAALHADAGHLPARESLAGLLLRQDRRRQAEQVLSTGLEANPQTPSLARLYARLILDRGQTDTAIRVLENALVNAVNDPEYLALLAGIYQRSQHYAEAASSYRAALSLDSGRAAWWLGLGLALEGEGELQPAARAYRSALANPGLNEATRRYARERLQRLLALLGRQ